MLAEKEFVLYLRSNQLVTGVSRLYFGERGGGNFLLIFFL